MHRQAQCIGKSNASAGNVPRGAAIEKLVGKCSPDRQN
jgi:hypothetical protein